MEEAVIAQRLLPWFEQHGRKDLPWQLDKDADGYRVWLSEIMLQQTQVSTVIPYFERFIDRFADFHALAAADVDEVLALWSGLGYYARARNLHACARLVVAQHGGRLPCDLAQLMQLPGIGRSTAGAILSLAFGRHAPILDGNVKRVLGRVYRVQGWAGQASALNEYWRLANQNTPVESCASYNQAMMDLGATLCTRSRPDCESCPLQDMCQSHQYGEQSLYPQSKPRKQRPQKHVWMLMHCDENRVLMEKRPPSGIWGGLWSLPELGSIDGLENWQQDRLGTTLRPAVRYDSLLRHQFSHFELGISVALIRVSGAVEGPGGVNDDDPLSWLPFDGLDGFGLPAPVLKIISQLQESGALTDT
jgi:A/G-specific adenine glycosylase